MRLRSFESCFSRIAPSMSRRARDNLSFDYLDEIRCFRLMCRDKKKSPAWAESVVSIMRLTIQHLFAWESRRNVLFDEFKEIVFPVGRSVSHERSPNRRSPSDDERGTSDFAGSSVAVLRIEYDSYSGEVSTWPWWATGTRWKPRCSRSRLNRGRRSCCSEYFRC